MAKRFTDSEKWRGKWFRRLPSRLKLLWAYMLDSCDAAGIWDLDLELFEILTGEAVTAEEFSEAFEHRIIRIAGSDKVWIKGFIPFQYGILSEDSRPHKVVLDILRKYGVSIGYPKGIDTLQYKDKDQDKDKDKDQDKGKGGAGGKPVTTPKPTRPPPTPEQVQAFETARRAYPGTKNGHQTEIANFWPKFGPEADTILPKIIPAIEAERRHMERQKRIHGWAKPWKHFATWINQRCWEQELGAIDAADQPQRDASRRETVWEHNARVMREIDPRRAGREDPGPDRQDVHDVQSAHAGAADAR